MEHIELATQAQISGSDLEAQLPVVSGAPRWAEEIPAKRRRQLRIWLLLGAALTALTLVVGGITRLTESGLSIVDWAPIVGSVPPITNADWQEAFARYQQYPEYLKLRPDMTLSDFKQIYFWEFLHRSIGRLIGIVFLLPFLYFLIRGYFNRPLLRRVMLLFVLGGLQGLMGWYMVSSGLVDRPDVSHYRLAAHLLLAMTIFGSCIWFANDLMARPRLPIARASQRSLMRWLSVLGILLVVQITWGAFVAGLNAGFILNTFPLMNGSLLPPNGWSQDPLLINLVENLATVQWVHRVLATVLLIGGIALFFRIRRDATLERFQPWGLAFMVLVALQYSLGVTTLLTHVKTGIAVTHQVTALIIVGFLITFLHQVWESAPRAERVEANPEPGIATSAV